MAPTDDSPARSPQQDQQRDVGRVSQNHSFSARIESFRDIGTLGYGYYDDELVSPPGSPPLRGRESMLSAPTQSVSSTPEIGRSTSGRWTRPFSTSTGGGYQPVTGIGAGTPPVSGGLSRAANIRNSYAGQSSDASSHVPAEDTPEERESVDIALLPAAAPIGGAGEEECSAPPSPSSPRRAPCQEDNEETKRRQEQEQSGQLTGGLGAGFRTPAIQIREADLSSPVSPIMQRMPSTAMPFSQRKLSLNRSATRKALGQNEANRTGQAVQVIVEEPEADTHKEAINPLIHRDSKIDLSFVAGDTMPVELEELRDFSKRRSTFQSKSTQRVEIFYPTPNWKPFSMRWPYLLMLIMLSFTLAGLTEALYQYSAKKGHLLTFHKPSEIEGIAYFSIKFLPTLLAVIYGVLWQMTDFEVKRLEAYYQLSKEEGATAAETLNVDYLTSYSFLAPFDALRRRHYAVTVSSIASLLAVSAIPTLCSAAINLSPDRATRMDTPYGPKEISINAVFSRLNEAVLIIVALLGCVLFYQLSTRRSGLLADVKGIAGLAAMANVSHILMDFKDCDVATHEDIHKKLKKRRYHLRNSSLAPIDDDYRGSAFANDDLAKITTQAAADHKSSAKYHMSLNPHPIMFRARGAIPFICGISLFTILLPIFLFTPLGVLTDKAPWVITALAVCIKLSWGALDTTIRLMEPYFILYKRHAQPRTLTLDYTALPFAWVAIKALLNGHWLVFAVGLGTVMTEVLTVLVSSLATVEGQAFKPSNEKFEIDAGEETVHSFWTSLAFATCILLYMGIVTTVVFVRRRKPFLPRQPNTIASVLAFIHQSKMLYDFVGTEKYNNHKMLQHLTDIGKRYGLGWFEGRDGRIHCGVDEEELSATYRHGVDYSRSNMPWVQDFTEWL